MTCTATYYYYGKQQRYFAIVNVLSAYVLTVLQRNKDL